MKQRDTNTIYGRKIIKRENKRRNNSSRKRFSHVYAYNNQNLEKKNKNKTLAVKMRNDLARWNDDHKVSLVCFWGSPSFQLQERKR